MIVERPFSFFIAFDKFLFIKKIRSEEQFLLNTFMTEKHCRHPIAVMGVVDTFGPYNIHQKETWLATLKVSGSENLDFFSG